MKYIEPAWTRARKSLCRAARKGQTTVEYLLMLATIAGMALAFGLIFYKHILKLFFIMVGITVGAGEPS